MLKQSSTPSVPEIRTALPGPLSKLLIEQDEAHTSSSYTRDYPLAVRRGYGMTIEDLDGNRFLDFTAGIAVCATGHCHPRVVNAIQKQASQLLHMSGTDFYYGPQASLARRLAEIAPGDSDKRVFFANSGAESVEAALKLARYSTGRKHVVAFRGAFHGRTMGALSLTCSKTIQRRGFLPLVPEVSHIEFPNCDACPIRPVDSQCCGSTFDQLERLFSTSVAPDEVAAIIVEPIQGEGGYIVPPDGFHAKMSAIAREHGILYVADEVQSGMGRTGKMFAIEHWGVEPDIVCVAKGIASGMPLGAIIAKSEVMNWPPGAHASTFGGNPVSCAAALETIDLLEEELIENAASSGEYLLRRLVEIANRNELLARPRGLGLMLAVDVGGDGMRNQLVQECFKKGLLLLGCGNSGIRFCPPLIVTQAEIDTALSLFESALGRIKHD